MLDVDLGIVAARQPCLDPQLRAQPLQGHQYRTAPLFRYHRHIFDGTPLEPLGDRILADAVTLGNLCGGGFRLLSLCSNSVRGLRAAGENLPHSSLRCVGDKFTRSHAGTKYLFLECEGQRIFHSSSTFGKETFRVTFKLE